MFLSYHKMARYMAWKTLVISLLCLFFFHSRVAILFNVNHNVWILADCHLLFKLFARSLFIPPHRLMNKRLNLAWTHQIFDTRTFTPNFMRPTGMSCKCSFLCISNWYGVRSSPTTKAVCVLWHFFDDQKATRDKLSPNGWVIGNGQAIYHFLPSHCHSRQNQKFVEFHYITFDWTNYWSQLVHFNLFIKQSSLYFRQKLSV
jgi:hypothetical protein